MKVIDKFLPVIGLDDDGYHIVLGHARTETEAAALLKVPAEWTPVRGLINGEPLITPVWMAA